LVFVNVSVEQFGPFPDSLNYENQEYLPWLNDFQKTLMCHKDRKRLSIATQTLIMSNDQSKVSHAPDA
jgi:hypothetical protein